jgi:hypothetical protein
MSECEVKKRPRFGGELEMGYVLAPKFFGLG